VDKGLVRVAGKNAEPKNVFCVLAVAALLQGWLYVGGFVCLVNVLRYAVGC
jgi:hypothetical protein